jgi:signal transduction histidine kinase
LTEFEHVPVTFSTCGAAVQRKERVIVDNIELDSEFAHLTPLFASYNAAAVQSTPLLQGNGKVLGVLSTYFPKPQVLTPQTLALLDLYAHQTERVLEAKQREEMLRGANRDLVKVAGIHRQRLVDKEQMLRGLISELAGTEQRERRHLADELHDYLAQLLTAAKMKLRRAQEGVKQESWSEADRYLSETDDALKKSLVYTRTLMAELSPRELLESGLPAALRWLAGQMPKHGLEVAVSTSCESLPLSKEHVIMLFQSVRELLTNVAKHASVTQARLSLSVTAEHTLLITVEDDGRGFTPSTLVPNGAGEHFGLPSIRERMILLGGSLNVESRPGHGTRITLSVPLKALLHIVKVRAATSAPKDTVDGKHRNLSNEQSVAIDTPSEE